MLDFHDFLLFVFDLEDLTDRIIIWEIAADQFLTDDNDMSPGAAILRGKRASLDQGDFDTFEVVRCDPAILGIGGISRRKGRAW